MRSHRRPVIEAKDDKHIDVNGWNIVASEGPISDAATRASVEAGHALPLPEMYFGANVLRIEHKASGFAMEFSALDAFANARTVPPDDSVKIKAAKTWKCSVKVADRTVPVNWIYANTYMGTVRRAGAEPEPLSWSPLLTTATTRRIDFDRLRRPDPILWFRETPLYEDELADGGLAVMSVKVRVMPTCFFVLLRYWLRVDDVCLRVRDTRVYHAFGDPDLVLEHTFRADTVEEMAARGLSVDMSKYTDPNAVQAVLTLRDTTHLAIPLATAEAVDSTPAARADAQPGVAAGPAGAGEGSSADAATHASQRS